MTKQQKLDYLLEIMPNAIYELADLMAGHGKQKHGDRGSFGKPVSENIKHLEGHVQEILNNEMIDPESGKSGFIHIMGRAGILHEQTGF